MMIEKSMDNEKPIDFGPMQRTLLFLYQKGKTKAGAFIEIANYSTAIKAAQRLMEIGLVKMEEEMLNNKLAYMYSITDLGKEVAEEFLKIDKMIKSQS